jgi:hypothetical protein
MGDEAAAGAPASYFLAAVDEVGGPEQHVGLLGDEGCARQVVGAHHALELGGIAGRVFVGQIENLAAGGEDLLADLVTAWVEEQFAGVGFEVFQRDPT